MTIAIDIGSGGAERNKNVYRKPRRPIEESLEYWLDVALEDSFPCSDPISSMRTD
jgi:hypothetical protein